MFYAAVSDQSFSAGALDFVGLFFNDPILKINVYLKVAFLDESHISLKRLKVYEENGEKIKVDHCVHINVF